MTYDEILTAMNAAYTERSGFTPDDASDLGIRFKVVAKATEALYEELEKLGTQVFPQTATGKHLEMHAQIRGLERKPAVASTGNLKFYRETAAPGDIFLPAGIICTTKGEPQVQFETTEDGVLESGETETFVSARALWPGKPGNVAANTVSVMITSAPGITGAINPAAFTGGIDAEADEALRNRLLHSYMNISNGTNTAFYYDIAMRFEGVSSVNVLPRNRGRGTVDVVICCDDPVRETEVSESLADIFFTEKEINVDVSVYPATRDAHSISLQITTDADADFAIVSANCRRRILDYMERLEVGAPLLLARFGQAILDVEGVYNYRLISPTADLLPGADHVIRPGAVVVERIPD